MISKILNMASSGVLCTSAYAETLLKCYALSEQHVFHKQGVLLKRELEYAVKHCGFYRHMFCDATPSGIDDFPVIQKQTIITQFNQFTSDLVMRYQHSDAYTGGSTGEPFHFLNSGGYEYEFGLRKWKNFGYTKGDLILALDGTAIDPSDLSRNIYWKRRSNSDIPFGRYSISSLYLTEANAEYYFHFIVSMKPQFLRGYPSFLYTLACYAEKAKFNLACGIKGIELTSETVMPYQIEKIETVYNTKVYLQYGHTESCVFGYTYDNTYRYRIEPLYGYVEVLNDSNNHVQAGEVGEVVVTSLYNRAMPLIRYRTGDYAEYGGRDDRYIYFNNIFGRTQDYIINRNGVKVFLTALIFGQHCHALGHIVKWQLEQNEVGKVHIHLIKSHEYQLSDEAEIRTLFEKLGNVQLTFNYTDSIALTGRGKSNMIVQNIT